MTAIILYNISPILFGVISINPNVQHLRRHLIIKSTLIKQLLSTLYDEEIEHKNLTNNQKSYKGVKFHNFLCYALFSKIF
jgi:hypothetical protein